MGVTVEDRKISHFNMTCCVHIPLARSVAEWCVESVVTDRPRMSFEVERALADGLPAGTAMLEAAVSAKD